IRIQASGGLSDADIDQMVKDAEEHAEDDKKKRALIEAKNQAESLLHQTQKALDDVGGDVPAEERDNVEKAMSDLRSILDGDDRAAIEERTNDLMQASMKLGEIAYRKAQENAAGAPDNADAAPQEQGAE